MVKWLKGVSWLGRRRKRRKVIPKRVAKIPTVFVCPRCSSRALNIVIKRIDDYRASAVITCGSCDLLDDEDFAEIPAVYQAVDVYAKFIDLYNAGRARIKSYSSLGEESVE